MKTFFPPNTNVLIFKYYTLLSSSFLFGQALKYSIVYLTRCGIVFILVWSSVYFILHLIHSKSNNKQKGDETDSKALKN